MSTNTVKRSSMDLVITFAPAILLVIAGFWFAYQFVAPPPPKKLLLVPAPRPEPITKLRSNTARNLPKKASNWKLSARPVQEKISAA